jgi:hypothetical protein
MKKALLFCWMTVALIAGCLTAHAQVEPSSLWEFNGNLNTAVGTADPHGEVGFRCIRPAHPNE